MYKNIISAKCGHKSIPNKNIMAICGNLFIPYTIDAGKKLGLLFC